MHGKLLEEVSSEKDLGVVFSKDFEVRQECKEVYEKASQIMGLIHRTIQFKDPAVLISLYKSMLRDHTWRPDYVKDKALLEGVQHRFIRMFPELKDLPYLQRLAKLRSWLLNERRYRANLIIEIFKMVNSPAVKPPILSEACIGVHIKYLYSFISRVQRS